MVPNPPNSAPAVLAQASPRLTFSAAAQPAANALLDFTAIRADRAPGHTALPLSWIAGNIDREIWCVDSDDDALIAGTLTVPLDDEHLEATVEDAYRTLLARTEASGHRHLLRVWNFIDRINAGVGDAERYRRFVAARARVLPSAPATGFAAATAIGIPSATRALHLAWLAARAPATPIENPRQLSAWRYPRRYGPVAPGFSRAMRIDWTTRPVLLVSGTASVVGHISVHDHADAQLDEALTNLERVLSVAAADIDRDPAIGPDTWIKLYVRHRHSGAALAERLRVRLGDAVPLMVVEGDICRPELLVELEAVHTFA